MGAGTRCNALSPFDSEIGGVFSLSGPLVNLTPFRTAFWQFSLPLSKMERGKIERA